MARLDNSETKNINFPNWRKVITTDEAEYQTIFKGLGLKRPDNAALAVFLHGLAERYRHKHQISCRFGRNDLGCFVVRFPKKNKICQWKMHGVYYAAVYKLSVYQGGGYGKFNERSGKGVI